MLYTSEVRTHSTKGSNVIVVAGGGLASQK